MRDMVSHIRDRYDCISYRYCMWLIRDNIIYRKEHENLDIEIQNYFKSFVHMYVIGILTVSIFPKHEMCT